MVDALRKIGATVQPLHTIGQGCPDLLVGYHGENFLLEVKDGTKPSYRRRLTKDESEWLKEWKGTVHVVTSAEQALELVTEGA